MIAGGAAPLVHARELGRRAQPQLLWKPLRWRLDHSGLGSFAVGTSGVANGFWYQASSWADDGACRVRATRRIRLAPSHANAISPMPTSTRANSDMRTLARFSGSSRMSSIRLSASAAANTQGQIWLVLISQSSNMV